MLPQINLVIPYVCSSTNSLARWWSNFSPWDLFSFGTQEHPCSWVSKLIWVDISTAISSGQLLNWITIQSAIYFQDMICLNPKQSETPIMETQFGYLSSAKLSILLSLIFFLHQSRCILCQKCLSGSFFHWLFGETLPPPLHCFICFGQVPTYISCWAGQ